MEDSKIFKNFIVDVLNMSAPKRIKVYITSHEEQLKNQPLNFRKKKKEIKPTSKIISIDPGKDNLLLDDFIAMLEFSRNWVHKIDRVGIICYENAVRLAKYSSPPPKSARHYLFGQNIDVCSTGTLTSLIKELTYVDIWDLEFSTYSLKNTSTVVSNKLANQLRFIKKKSHTADLPF